MCELRTAWPYSRRILLPDGGLAHGVVYHQVRLAVLGEGGPQNRDFTVASAGISGEKRTFLYQGKSYQFKPVHTSLNRQIQIISLAPVYKLF